MHRRAIHSALIAFAVIVALPCVGRSQANATKLTTADSVYARALQLVANGNGAAGRVLVDSMVTVTTPDTPPYAEALYWRARLAATGSDAERDYRRIVVEYPLSSRTGDALLKLAQLEAARGDRLAAATHLDRFLLENPQHDERHGTGLLVVRLWFEQNDAQRGCIALGRVLREVGPSEVELRNQLTYYSPRCAGVDTTRRAAAAVDSAASKRDSTRRDTSAARKATGRFTVQVAAPATRAEADRIAARLKAQGFDVRVVGTVKPFRVRVGRYATRAAATAAAGKLRAQKIDAFVTEIGGEER